MAPQAIEIAQNGLGQIRQLGVARKENRSVEFLIPPERSGREEELRKSALKPLKSLARSNLCARSS
jgi:hypothetical protein